MVVSAPISDGSWAAFDMGGELGRGRTVYAQSRAAAMRAAEHLAMRR